MNIQPQNIRPLVFLSRRLKQDLFAPPNVKGWRGGVDWLDSNSVLLRQQALDRFSRSKMMQTRGTSLDTRQRFVSAHAIPHREQIAWLSIGLATQNLLLAAHDLGLGACPVASFHQAGISIFLDLPADVRPVLLLTLGYPAVKPTPPGRRPLSDICFAESWGNPYE
jgi:nitroreductase